MREYFSALIGNEETKARLGRAIESNTLPHAFLIGGPSGSGKSILATELAAALNCEKRGASDRLPCGECNSCRRIREGNFPDVKTLSKRNDRQTIGVDAVKDFREDMFLSATEADSKIYIIDDAECMTLEAQNALLKVLEEPPTSVRILLLAKECDRILTTIKSRTQYIAMSRFEEAELEEWLLSESIEARAMKSTDPVRFKGIIMSADGRLGLAKGLLNKRQSEDNRQEREDVVNLLLAVCRKDSYADIYSITSHFPTKRSELQLVLERLMSALRDLLVIKYHESAKTVFFSSAEEAAEQCGDISREKLVRLYDAVNEAHALCTRNANVSNLIANLTSKIKLA